MTLSTAVTQDNNLFLVSPNNITEAMSYAKMIADSSFCPKEMKGKAGDVLIAIQMGAEVGLSPLQALQNIAVINGRPCIWGDAALALIIVHPYYESHREWMEGSIEKGDRIACCAVKRRGQEEYIKSFSMNDAKKANLWSKLGVWQQYPDRMLQMRARAFAIRDKFADALRGLNFREEVEDYNIKSHIQKNYVKQDSKIIDIESVVVVEEKKVDFSLDEILLDISQTTNEEQLKTAYLSHYKKIVALQDKESLSKLIEAKNQKKSELNMKEFQDAYGSDEQQDKESTNETTV